MNGTRMTAAALLLLALLAAVGTLGYPGGSQGVPGPALVPRLVALVLGLAAAWVLARPGAADSPPPVAGRGVAIGWTLAGLVAYAALWNVVPFVVRTVVFLVLFLRLLDIAWRPAAVTAVALAGAVFVLFEHLLAIRL